MDKLISKLQYKTYETGEFSAEMPRSIEETLDLIKNYPWLSECHLTSIGLTEPSVTIQGNDGNYLKVGHYYNDQFCLYFYTGSGDYLKKNALKMDEVLAIVTDFFNGKDIQNGFHKENSIGVKKHFISKDFIYEVTGKRIFWYMIGSIIYTIVLSSLIVFILIKASGRDLYVMGSVFILVWFFLCGIDWILFFNYYFYSKKLFLKISKGQNEFLFGHHDNYKQYNKTDITSLIKHVPRSSSNGRRWIKYEFYNVTFNDGTEITFNNLMISSFLLYQKFGEVKTIYINNFVPFIKKKQ